MATVSAKITGKVLEVRIEEGQRVEEGDIMATLDPVDADAERALAASQLAAARSQIGGVQAQLHEAEVDAKRLATLVGQQLVSKSQYDQAVAQRAALRAQITTAQRNADDAADRLAIADNGVHNAIARAPFAVVITHKPAPPGPPEERAGGPGRHQT